ncbi:MAG: MFS transporter [Dehalococcoidia bacterium]
MRTTRTVFYGWWLVLGLFVIGALGSLGRFNLTAFLPFMMSELGWSRSTIGLAQSLAIWMYAFFVLAVGVLVDRIGSRKTFLIGGAVTLLGWVLFSTVQFPWQLNLHYGVILALAVSMTHYVPIMATGRKWFSRRAGLVTGITGAAWAVGNAVFLPVMTRMADAQGWRETSLILGICFGLIIVAIGFLLVRDTPESVGLHADGERSVPDPAVPAAAEVSWTVRHAMKTRSFVLLFVTYSIYNIGMSGLAAHVVAWGTDLGSPEAAAGVFSTAFAAPWAIGCVAGGWLGDRYGKSRIMPLGLMLSTAAMFYGWLGVHSQQGLMVLAAAVGFGTGLQVSLYVPLLGDLFGRARVGSLFGILTFGYGAIGGWGPFIWASLRELSGQYNLAALVSAVCYAVGTVALLLVRPTRGEVR